MRLIFEPGFSTTQDVTQTSGRGVGMDVVSSAVSHLGGSISVSSIPGEGTTLSLDLPLSVALQRTLLVELGPQLFAIPDRRVVGIVRANGGSTVDLPNEKGVPIAPLGELLGMPGGDDVPDERLVVISSGGRSLGLRVDRILRRSDIFVRDTHPAIARIPGLGGVTHVADGRIAMILDPDGLIALSERDAGQL